MTHSDSFDVRDALDLATYAAPSWNDAGRYVGYRRFSGGETGFAARRVDRFDETDLSLAAALSADDAFAIDADVSDHAWRPGADAEVALVVDGDVVVADVESGTKEPIADAGDDHGSLAWHPDGDELAYTRDGSVWLHDLERGRTREVTDAAAELFGPTPVEWSADGRLLATLTETEAETLALTVYAPHAPEAGSGDADGMDDTADGADDAADGTDDVTNGTATAGDVPVAFEYAPSPAEEAVADSFDWAGERLVFARDATDGTEREYRVVDLGPDALADADLDAPGGQPDATGLLTEREERGLGSAAIVGHESGRVALGSATSGFHHVYAIALGAVVDAVADDPVPLGGDAPGVTQVTSGSFEARGDAMDAPAWDDAGERLAFVTNDHDVGERRLHVAHLADDADGLAVTGTDAFADVGGNAVRPSWADGRIVCIRSGTRTPADVHVFDPETEAARRISAGHPDPDLLAEFPEPEPVSFESSVDGETVHGYLYTPADGDDADASSDRPAVVWTHGGPVRQMRRGFHHMRSYAFFHAFNGVLVDRGYAVLELNYRGGIGYGKEYQLGIHHAIGEVDVGDCVDAADFLRSREGIGDEIGFWGLSYGGFLANAMATKTDAYDCAVNFAGIWDWRDWVRYATGRNWGAGRRFVPLFGGHPDDDDPEVEERYRVGSPCDHADGLDTPLFALHGTADPNVDFNQMDILVEDLVDRGADFEMAYYPNEDHMFQRSETWVDTMDRVLPFLDEHLQS